MITFVRLNGHRTNHYRLETVHRIFMYILILHRIKGKVNKKQCKIMKKKMEESVKECEKDKKSGAAQFRM